MAVIVENKELSSSIRVALIVESGKIKPVWFEETGRSGRDRVLIKEICQIWSHQEGVAKVINFAVSDGFNSYRLSLNTRDLTCKLGIAKTSQFP